MLQPLSVVDATTIANMEGRFLLFFYTPLCGTCKVARKMLEVVDATMPQLTIYTCDANFAAPLLQDWQVTSVPALVYIDEDKSREIQFAFADISQLYQRIQTFVQS